jgi:hypothetical protein
MRTSSGGLFVLNGLLFIGCEQHVFYGFTAYGAVGSARFETSMRAQLCTGGYRTPETSI